MRKQLLLFLFLGLHSLVSQEQESKWSVTGYADSYYTYDFNKPADHSRTAYLYNFTRHNEFSVNLALIRLAFSSDRSRFNVALMAGTYAQSNLAAEPTLFQHVYEANAGVELKKDLWLDAGVFSSHIGFESAVSKDNWALTRSMVAENSPYYLSGVKLTYTPNSAWIFSGVICNGWQRIQRVDSNSTLGFGTQIYYKASDKFTLNHSSFFGNDKPDSASQFRIFNNLYGILNLNDQWSFTIGFDLGLQQKHKKASDYHAWYGTVMIARYVLAQKCALAGRFERYIDKHQVIVTTSTARGFQTNGYSLNLDYAHTKNAVMRIEIRRFDSIDPVFVKNNKPVKNNTSITSSLAVSF